MQIMSNLPWSREQQRSPLNQLSISTSTELEDQLEVKVNETTILIPPLECIGSKSTQWMLQEGETWAKIRLEIEVSNLKG